VVANLEVNKGISGYHVPVTGKCSGLVAEYVVVDASVGCDVLRCWMMRQRYLSSRCGDYSSTRQKLRS